MADSLEAARQRVAAAKRRFNQAVRELIADAPNAARHCNLALAELNAAQAALRELTGELVDGGKSA